MASSLAWIDFDETERQRVQRINALFAHRESRDELGLGAIRDSIADHLFPGTSTIQTRLRYVLFVPWLYKRLEHATPPPAQLRSQARKLELGLTRALASGGEKKGVFGSESEERLKRLPSSVYWACLGAWGIRTFPGSIEGLIAHLSRRGRANASASAGEEALTDAPASDHWNPSLPAMPADLLDQASFRLSQEEAQFLLDRLIATQPSSLLTWLARENDDSDCDFVWKHPRLKDFPADMRRRVRHSELFSQAMQGAALVYNLALSELREQDDWIDRYRSALGDWSATVDTAALQDWSLEDFWTTVDHPAHSIRHATRRFVEQWREQVLHGPDRVASSPQARELVEQRESGLKRGQSRYRNRSARDRWNGASGIAPLGFRWPQAKSHLQDLAHAR